MMITGERVSLNIKWSRDPSRIFCGIALEQLEWLYRTWSS